MPKPLPEVAALNPYTPVPATDEKLRPPTPAESGLKAIPPTPAVTPLVAVAIPPTATGGTVEGEGTKGGELEPPCVAPTMALLKAVVLAVTVCGLVKLFVVLSWGTTAGSIASVPEVMIGPPLRPNPLPTLVTVPAPPTDAQTHAAPFHCNTCPLPQVLIKLRFAAPDVAPPINPLPAAVFTA